MRSIVLAGERNPAGTGTKPQNKITPMKTPQLRNGARTQGFTLIELLVVISIIAILAGFALPVFTSAQKKGRITDSVSNAKQVTLGLRLYSSDNDGSYPNTTVPVAGAAAGTALTTSNDAFSNLMPKYTTSKKIFINKGSKYCKPTTPVVEQAGEENKVLPGQNDWNYVPGLSDTSDARWPLIATATTAPGDMTYKKASTAPGGVWGGTDAVIGYCDGSVRPATGKEMDTTNLDATFVKSPDPAGGNILTGTATWLGATTIVLTPPVPQ